jgi:hypothetical protein
MQLVAEGVSSTMEVKVSALQCYNKWSELKKRYKDEMKNIKRSGEGTGKPTEFGDEESSEDNAEKQLKGVYHGEWIYFNVSISLNKLKILC